MKETVFLYTFLAVMCFNLLASLVYLMGMEQVKVAIRKTFTRETTKR